MALDNTLLYCRSCKKQINSGAKRCPQCGAEDPFYFKNIRVNGNLLGFAKYIVPFVGACMIAAIPKGDTVEMVLIIFFVSCVVLYYLTKYIVEKYFINMKRNIEKDYLRVCDEKNDRDTYYNWTSKIPTTVAD